MIVIIIRDICQIKDDENPLEAVAWGSEAGRRRTEVVCSIGAVVFPHLQKPSCVFFVGEEEEGRAWGRVGCVAGHPGAQPRLPSAAAVPCRAVPCHAVPRCSRARCMGDP